LRYINHMSAHQHTRQITARLPEALADALVERAEELGVSPSAVVREALAREVSVPVDPRDRSFLSAWLNGEV